MVNSGCILRLDTYKKQINSFCLQPAQKKKQTKPTSEWWQHHLPANLNECLDLKLRPKETTPVFSAFLLVTKD
ncbi:rCG28477 [Rattus norvegicus]|uniref:RCG28477 n=1 Tax=Rattus norvegicus TaxID=10116 RepID=A6HWB2_RAT|nr:rCG28477 [Rattus norvegicus]